MASLLKLTNNALGRLNASITTSSTTIQLVPGQGAKFPSLAAGEFFPCTLLAADGTLEIVKVTARSGDNLTVLRGQEGTAASAFAISDRCELRLTGGAMQGEMDRIAAIADSYAGTIASIGDAVALALPKTGGILTGTTSLANNVQFRGIDTDGNARAIVSYGGDNNVNHVCGTGGFWNLYNSTGAAVIFHVANNGDAVFTGKTIIDTSGTGGQRGLQINNIAGNAEMAWVGATGSKALRLNGNTLEWINNAYSATIASLSDAGDFTCKTLTTTSDENKKTNWQPISDEVLDRLADMVLAGFFDWIDGSGSSLGGSAQELRCIGLAVAVAEDAEGNLSVNYSSLAFAIVQAMLRRDKVSKAEIERRLAALEAK